MCVGKRAAIGAWKGGGRCCTAAVGGGAVALMNAPRAKTAVVASTESASATAVYPLPQGGHQQCNACMGLCLRHCHAACGPGPVTAAASRTATAVFYAEHAAHCSLAESLPFLSASLRELCRLAAPLLSTAGPPLAPTPAGFGGTHRATLHWLPLHLG